MVFSEIFGESLLSHDGFVQTSSLEGKYVALYFSYLPPPLSQP